MTVRLHWFLAAIVAVVAPAAVGAMADDYATEVAAFRAAQEERLRSDTGWLTMAALYFLTDGEHQFGAGPLNDFVLPPGSALDEVGVLEFRDRETTIRAREGTTVTVNGEDVTSTVLTPSGEGRRPDRVTINDLTFWVHYSGDRKAIRLSDPNSPIRKAFTGRRWFPVNEKFRVVARFEPLPEPEPLGVPNILGDVERYTATGFVHFELDGTAYSMKALGAREGRLWFIFRDLTSGQETYPATRFLYADAPENGQVVVDFNKAVNPPCAFNPFTTCPLPLKENRLTVRITAGELDYHTPEQTTDGE